MILEPTARHHDVLVGLLDGVGTDGTVISYDTDFSRFLGVTWTTPTGT